MNEMNRELHNIHRLFDVIDNSLFMTTGTLDYQRVTEAIIKLAQHVRFYDGDNDDIWYIGELGACCLSDLIVGAYWHYFEWHAGQWSKGYAALCALGSVFDPGMTMPETGNEAYIALNEIAE